MVHLDLHCYLKDFSKILTWLCFSFPKDFGIMFLHHLVSIFLITFSYVNNMARIGTLVLCLHDSADALLEVKVYFIFEITKPRIQEVQRLSLLCCARWCWGWKYMTALKLWGYFFVGKLVKNRLLNYLINFCIKNLYLIDILY